MNKDILKLWLIELKRFEKVNDYMHLRFPMRLEAVEGDMYSPEGLLCSLHAKETGDNWEPKVSSEKGRLRGVLFYGNETLVAPSKVLDWAGITPSLMSTIRGQNQEPNGFNSVIKYVEALINGNVDDIQTEVEESPDLKLVPIMEDQPKRRTKYAK